MKARTLIIVLLILSLVCVCGAAGVVGWTTAGALMRGGVKLGPLSVATTPAKETQEQSFAVEGQAILDLENTAGNVQVSTPVSATVGSSYDEVKVTYVKTAYGASEAEARERLKDIRVSLKQDGNRVTIRVEDSTQNVLTIDNHPSVDFTILAPVQTTALVRTRLGDINLAGTRGQAELASDFGNVAVNNVWGGLKLTSNSGKLSASQVQGLKGWEGDLAMDSKFGDISLQDVAVQRVTARSENGAIRLQNVEASGEVNISSNFGELSYTQGKNELLTAQAGNGKITLKDVETRGKVAVHSDFGDIRLSQVKAGSYELSGQNGNITSDRVSGTVKVTGAYGNIDLSGGEQATLDLTTKNGKIAYQGSLGNGPHVVQSDFGDLRISLPAGAALDISLKTDFGKITTDFQVTLSSGSFSEKELRGSVNGGGVNFKATTRNGDIVLQSSK